MAKPRTNLKTILKTEQLRSVKYSIKFDAWNKASACKEVEKISNNADKEIMERISSQVLESTTLFYEGFLT